jgi:D-glycero-D-manno-heptose 1,7-bisphosphate phosphatase
MSQPAVFLDRDGTVNEEMGYINHLSRFRLLPQAVPAIRRLNEAGVKVVVVTNQSGAARGYFPASLVDEVHALLQKILAAGGAQVDGIYACLHGPGEGCACRKPQPTLMEEAARDLDLDLSRSYAVGDRYKDIQTAANAGVKGILVLTGYGRGEYDYLRAGQRVQPVHVAPDLLEAVEWILRDLEEIDDIEKEKLHQRETISLMGNQEWREKTVVGEFLNRIDLDFSEEELKYIPQINQPPDVIFRDANFEVTSLLIKRKPNKEAKERLEILNEAKSINDTLIKMDWPHKITFAEINELVLFELKKKELKYPFINDRNTLDILIHFREPFFPDMKSEFPIPHDIISQGWRSVSILISSYAIVLYASSSAPNFIRENERIPKLSNSLKWWNASKN